MAIKETEARSLLRKQKRIDTWFLSRYGMNLYRGCAHNCAYCDGRAEGYYVEGDFEKDIVVKINAKELLRRELDPRRKRVPLVRSFIMIGGGVGDAYQPAEEQFRLARGVLEVIEEFGFPVHILTKSCLVERDLDVLARINERNPVIVSMSFSSARDEIARVFESGCSIPSQRLKSLSRLKGEGIATGVYLMPVIPYVTDTFEAMDDTLRQAKEAAVDFVIFGGMTLKEGRQKSFFLNVLEKHDPRLRAEYLRIYGKDKWGNAGKEYYAEIQKRFNAAAKKNKTLRRIPARIFKDALDENDLVVVVLENLDYLLRAEGRSSTFCHSARSVSQLREPISSMRTRLQDLAGVGKVTERLILEILDTGTCSYYESFF